MYSTCPVLQHKIMIVPTGNVNITVLFYFFLKSNYLHLKAPLGGWYVTKTMHMWKEKNRKKNPFTIAKVRIITTMWAQGFTCHNAAPSTTVPDESDEWGKLLITTVCVGEKESLKMKGKKRSPGTPIHLCCRTAVAWQQSRHRNILRVPLNTTQCRKRWKQFGTTYLTAAKCWNLQLFQIQSSTSSTWMGSATADQSNSFTLCHCSSASPNITVQEEKEIKIVQSSAAACRVWVCSDPISPYLGLIFLSVLPIVSRIRSHFSRGQYFKSRESTNIKAACDSSETHISRTALLV